MNTRNISRTTATAAALAVVLLVALGWAAYVMVADMNKQGGGDAGVGVHGLSVPLIVDERIGRAALVVVGTPTRVEVKAFRDAVSASELPANERTDPIYLNGSFNRYVVDVESVIKSEGQPPGSQIDVRTYADTPGVAIEGSGRPDIEIGKRYVFILFHGGGVWQDGWLILGKNGLATLDGATASFPSGERFSLDELTEMG